jgi:hypothetical protein
MQEREKFNDIKSYLRDLKFSVLFDDTKITLDEFIDWGGFFYKKRRKCLETLVELGAVLTGSTALSLYKINGQKIFGRYPDDLDFVLTKDNFVAFCGLYNLTDVTYTNTVVSINLNTGKYRGRDSYGGDRGHFFGSQFDIIGDDEPKNYQMSGKMRVQNLIDIINYKTQLIESYLGSGDRTLISLSNKHINDLWTLISKLNSQVVFVGLNNTKK